MGITGGFGTLIDFVTGRPRRWYMRADGIRRWVSNDQPCDTANDADLWRCTVCGRTGTVGRCCGEETREPVRAPNSVDYTPHKADCLNGAEHILKFRKSWPHTHSRMCCQDCDYERPATESELSAALAANAP